MFIIVQFSLPTYVENIWEFWRFNTKHIHAFLITDTSCFINYIQL